MVERHERAVSRKARDGKKDGESDSDSSDGAGLDPGGESEVEGDEPPGLLGGEHDDAGDDEARRVPIEHEPRPSVGDEFDEGGEGIAERDWARAGIEERLSAAGAAPVTKDRSTRVVQAGDVRVGNRDRLLYNPVDYPYEDTSVVSRQEVERLQNCLKAWKGGGVADGADAIEREELDGWQRFAHDIALRRGQTTDDRPVRCFLIGSAGTGKSRTVRSFVSAKRAVVKTKLERTFDARKLLTHNVQEEIKEAVRYSVQLGAPTGCASFQLKFGASTLHRLFGVPIGYCGQTEDIVDRIMSFLGNSQLRRYTGSH